MRARWTIGPASTVEQGVREWIRGSSQVSRRGDRRRRAWTLRATDDLGSHCGSGRSPLRDGYLSRCSFLVLERGSRRTEPRGRDRGASRSYKEDARRKGEGREGTDGGDEGRGADRALITRREDARTRGRRLCSGHSPRHGRHRTRGRAGCGSACELGRRDGVGGRGTRATSGRE